MSGENERKNHREQVKHVLSLKENQQKIHENAKLLFEHELDEKECERYKIQYTEKKIELGDGRNRENELLSLYTYSTAC